MFQLEQQFVMRQILADCQKQVAATASCLYCSLMPRESSSAIATMSPAMGMRYPSVERMTRHGKKARPPWWPSRGDDEELRPSSLASLIAGSAAPSLAETSEAVELAQRLVRVQQDEVVPASPALHAVNWQDGLFPGVFSGPQTPHNYMIEIIASLMAAPLAVREARAARLSAAGWVFAISSDPPVMEASWAGEGEDGTFGLQVRRFLPDEGSPVARGWQDAGIQRVVRIPIGVFVAAAAVCHASLASRVLRRQKKVSRPARRGAGLDDVVPEKSVEALKEMGVGEAPTLPTPDGYQLVTTRVVPTHLGHSMRREIENQSLPRSRAGFLNTKPGASDYVEEAAIVS